MVEFTIFYILILAVDRWYVLNWSLNFSKIELSFLLQGFYFEIEKKGSFAQLELIIFNNSKSNFLTSKQTNYAFVNINYQ